jgi:hypothetical protein
VSFKDGNETSQLSFKKTYFEDGVLQENPLPKLQVFGIMLITREA